MPPITERDFALFMAPEQLQQETKQTSAPRGAKSQAARQSNARQAAARPAAAPRPARPVVTTVAEREESMAEKKEKARVAWKKTLIAYGTSLAVAACLFGSVQTEVAHLQALNERQALLQELNDLQQVAITRQAAIEQKYSLDVIQDYALKVLRMTPVEGGRIFYAPRTDGDKVLK